MPEFLRLIYDQSSGYDLNTTGYNVPFRGCLLLNKNENPRYYGFCKL